MSLLAKKLDEKAAPPAPAPSRLEQALTASPRGEYAVMPLLGRVWIELPGEAIESEIEGAVFAAMKALDLAPIAINGPSYDAKRMAMRLAWAVRDPDNHAERVGTAELWSSRVDLHLLNACGLVLQDSMERLAPVQLHTLSQDDLDAIRLGIEKKNPKLLRSAGVAALSLYLLTTADPPANSPTTPSSTGESQ